MTFHDIPLTRFDHLTFQTAFRAYFAELGCHVNNWADLFAEMTAAGTDTAFLRLDSHGQTVGFILFTTLDMKSWFFETKCGFIREFWVAPHSRRQGHGTDLLHQAERALLAAGCAWVLLTTDTAPSFYLQRGYTAQPGILAKNHDDVYAKPLAP